jgi:hypothetical protein
MTLVDGVVQALKCFLVDTTPGNVEHDVNINRVGRCLPQDREFGERPGLCDLCYLDLCLLPDCPAQFGNQAVDLRVIFLALKGRQPEHVGIVVLKFGVVQGNVEAPLQNHNKFATPNKVVDSTT